MTQTAAMSEKAKFTKAKRTFSTGKMAFSMRIFLMSDEESTMDFIAVVVAVLMRPKRMLPRIRYSGKCSMLNLNMYENTAVMTSIMSSGLSTDAQDAATVLDLEVLGHERGEHAPVLLELAARYIALFACCHIRKARA